MARSSALKVFAVNVLVFLVLLGLIEAGGQILAPLWPSYDVLFLEPDRVVGWKEVPNLEWTWAGHRWYAADFSVDVRTNSLGFRDIDRGFAKPPGVERVALLGDSFIEAVQVPLEATAAKRLEQRLNSGDAPGGGAVWEVMNFGISNYGIGQYLLTWQQYASQFSPRYVAVFVSRLQMQRTLMKYEEGAFANTQNRRLWIRPTFEIEDDRLVVEPAGDFAEFSRLQDELVRTEFGGARMRRKKPILVLYYGRLLLGLLNRLGTRGDQPAVPDEYEHLVDVNFRILRELGQEVAAAAGRLAVIDVSRYLGDSESVSLALQDLCARNGLVYIPAYRDLMDANDRGVKTHWRSDYHFNEQGNAILANALYAWIVAEPSGH